MRKFNKWHEVEMSKPKKDKIVKYKTNLCPRCGAESIIQTVYCPHCGKRLKKGC